MEQKERHFHFNAPATYIEHQEITVQSGGVLNFGAPAEEEEDNTAKGPPASQTGTLPDELRSERAQELLERAQKAGWLDDDFRPTTCKSMAVLVAARIAHVLGLEHRWKPFESLWGMNDLRKVYAKSIGHNVSGGRIDEINNVLK